MTPETRLRAALREVAEDGTPAPDLWRRLSERRAADRGRGTRRSAALVAAAVVAAGGYVAVTATRPDRPVTPPLVTSSPDGLRGPLVPVLANALALTPGAVWAPDHIQGHLRRIDRATGAVTPNDLGFGTGTPVGAVTSGKRVWTTFAGQVARIDPATGGWLSVTGSIANDTPQALAPDGAGGVWAAGIEPAVYRVDARGRVARKITLPKQLPRPGIAVDGPFLWLNASGGRDAARVDTRTGRTTLLRLPYRGGNSQGNVAVTDGAVWMESGEDLLRLDRAGKVTATLRLGAGANVFGMAAAGNDLWVTANGLNALYRIDSAAARVIGSIGVVEPIAVAVDGTEVWVSGEEGVRRIDGAAVVGDLS